MSASIYSNSSFTDTPYGLKLQRTYTTSVSNITDIPAGINRVYAIVIGGGGAGSEVCTTFNEQKCEIRYETVYEQECSGAAPSGPACTTVNEQQCTTVSEQVCSTVSEEQCSTTTVSQAEQECRTVEEQKCETEYMIKYEEKCTTVR